MPMISNMDVFLKIAQEAHAEMQQMDARHRSPKPDGTPGFIIVFDPQRRSFKQALIAIAFSAMYFEALVYLSAHLRLGEAAARKIDRMFYEDRLAELGITDSSLLIRAKDFRAARKEIIHEKAVGLTEMESSPTRRAQDVAALALEFVSEVRAQIQ